MSNQYIIYNFCAQIQGTESEVSVIIVSLTRSSAVAKRPRYAGCRWKFCWHSKSFKVIKVYIVKYCVSSYYLL